ncbi:MAG: hypothetical protein PWP76_513 [Candidatus Diapherotrites archaeon]|nr:hypothetical protein [Candidatus Diapherotrites archaeon]MDN5367084.1 hypothetical protein [Candidatus Diapherotrites archaeon]
MSIRIHHHDGRIDEPDWIAIKLRERRKTHYHIAIRSKRKNNLHLKFKISDDDNVLPVFIDHAHTREPEEFLGHIGKIEQKRYLFLQNLPRFIAHKIIIDLDAVEGAASEAKTISEFENLVKKLEEEWKIHRSSYLRILFEHVLDLTRLARESVNLRRELHKGFKKKHP